MIPQEKQEKEVMEYLEEQLGKYNYIAYYGTILKIVRIILRRYDLFDTKDMPREE